LPLPLVPETDPGFFDNLRDSQCHKHRESPPIEPGNTYGDVLSDGALLSAAIAG
jgi:hypothetical protein